MNHSKRRVCFLGRTSNSLPHILSSETKFITPFYIDLEKTDDLKTVISSLDSFDPDYLIVLDPLNAPAEVIEHHKCFKIAYVNSRVTEFVSPTKTSQIHPLMQPDPDLSDAIQSEYQTALLIEKESTNSMNLERYNIIATSTLNFKSPMFTSIMWCSIPIPIDDRLFSAVKSVKFPPQFVYVENNTLYSTSYRDCLSEISEVLVIPGGYTDQSLTRTLDTDVFLNINRYPHQFLNERVPLHLAAGVLVISEPLHPTHGLEPNVDFLEIENPIDFCMILEELTNFPESVQRIRNSGRRKAEYFRASAVYEKLIREIEMSE